MYRLALLDQATTGHRRDRDHDDLSESLYAFVRSISRSQVSLRGKEKTPSRSFFFETTGGKRQEVKTSVWNVEDNSLYSRSTSYS
jgi:hypothetical protein